MSDKLHVNFERTDLFEETFVKMNYGPESELCSMAEVWSKKHGFSFQCFINGKWHSGEDLNAIQCTPENFSLYTPLHQKWKFFETTSDQANAVKSSNDAYRIWRKLTGHERAQYLYKVSRDIQKKQQLLAELESLDSQKPLNMSKERILPDLISCFYQAACWAEMWDSEMQHWQSLGVIFMTSQHNSLMPLCLSLCQALAAGNAVVIGIHPFHLSVVLLVETLFESGLPPGVLNVCVSQSWFNFPEFVEKAVIFAPSNIAAGQRKNIFKEACITNFYTWMRPTIVILEDADLNAAVNSVLESFISWDMFSSKGSKVLVQDKVKEAFLRKLKSQFKKLCSHSCVQNCRLSSVMSKQMIKEIESCLKETESQGAEILKLHEVNEQSCMYAPVIVSGIQMSSQLFAEEICGPVIMVLPFRTVKESVDMCNHEVFHCPVIFWTERLHMAVEVADKIKAGAISINCQNAENGSAVSSFNKYLHLGGRQGLFNFVKPAWQKVSVKESVISCTSTCSKNPREINNKKVPTFMFYYAGKLRSSANGMCSSVYGHDGQLLGYVSESSGKDAEHAIQSAYLALPRWEKKTVQARAEILLSIAENLEQRKAEFATCLNVSTGVPESECISEVNLCVQRLHYWAAYSNIYRNVAKATTVYGKVIGSCEPLGVICIFCPDKSPLLSFVSLLAPAIATGNTVVIIPSDLYPIPLLKMHQIFDLCSVPDGVINILSRSRAVLMHHKGLFVNADVVWFHAEKPCDSIISFINPSMPLKIWLSVERDWSDPSQGQGEEFYIHCTYTKTVCLAGGNFF